jgi:hypothetical protein
MVVAGLQQDSRPMMNFGTQLKTILQEQKNMELNLIPKIPGQSSSKTSSSINSYYQVETSPYGMSLIRKC